MSVYWGRRRIRNVRKLSLLSFLKSTISSKTTKPTVCFLYVTGS